MTSKIKWIKTNHKGLRYYEHPTRRHGKKKDRYYSIRFKVGDKDHSYGVGWVSDGVPEQVRREENNIGFEEYCLKLLREYRHNAKSHTGPKSPKEKRKDAEERSKAKAEEAERLEKEAVTYDTFFTDTYLALAKSSKKAKSVTREEGLHAVWIKPAIGDMAMKDVSPFHIEKLKSRMLSAKQSARSIEYALAIVRQVFNTALRLRILQTESPLTGVKSPKPDNKRERYLTKEEATALLSLLKERSKDVHDMTLLSLHAGLRFGEVASLEWADVDTKNRRLLIRDAKAGTRYAFLTDQAAEMLDSRGQGKPSELVFQGSKGKYDRISATFTRAVKNLKLNDGVEDRRLKIVFHSLRHSFASWLVEAGTDLYTVQKLLGHKTNVMTQRYAHMSDNRLRNAVSALGDAWDKENAKKEEAKVIDLA